MFKITRISITNFQIDYPNRIMDNYYLDEDRIMPTGPEGITLTARCLDDSYFSENNLWQNNSCLIVPEDPSLDPTLFATYIQWAYQIGKNPMNFLTSPDPAKRKLAEKILKAEKS